MSPIYMVAGEKGDGKSFFSMALLDYLTNNHDNCLLIDSDPLNPDVHTIYSKEVSSAILDLSIRDGWIELVNLCEANSDKTVVINGIANGIEGLEQHSKILLDCLFALKRHLVTFWVMSDDTRRLDHLARYKKVVGRRIIHIVNNEKYDNNSFRLTKSRPESQGFTHTGRIVYLPNLPEEVHEWFTDEKVTIKECIRERKVNSPSSSGLKEISDWQYDAKEYTFKHVNYGIEDIISVGNKTAYRTFTRRLADEIEAELKRDYQDVLDYCLFYAPGDRQVDAWDSDDIGDLLAEGKVRIEDLAAAAANGEDLDQADRLRLARALEPETEEEHQARLQREYLDGGNPIDFIPTKDDIRSKATNEYLDGGNPQGFMPNENEIRLRAGTYTIPF
jgi:hypothetical protein